MDQVQFVDDYRIMGITRPEEMSRKTSLVMWDMTTAKERQLIFVMPTGGILYKPKRLVDYSWAPAGVGLHRSDPAMRAVGIMCRGSPGKFYKDDDYMLVINAVDVCAHASKKSSFTTTIAWKTWERSTTVIPTSISVMQTISMSGCWLFAMTKGFSGWNCMELLRIYDFSAGTRGGRYPNRPPVRDVLLNLGRGVVDQGDMVWCFSEDNLLLFHVSLHLSLIREASVLSADVVFQTQSPGEQVNLLLWTL